MTRDVLFATILLIASLPSLADAQQATVVDDAYVSAARPNARLGRNAETRDLQRHQDTREGVDAVGNRIIESIVVK